MLSNPARVQIDKDRSGALSTDEVIAHLLSSFGSGPALKLLRVLDTNNDGNVTAVEWHNGWRSGEFEVEMDEAASTPNGGTKERVFRLKSKHLSSSNLLLAAQEPGGKKGKKSSKKVLPKIEDPPAIAPVAVE